jgi:hypothetical protein
MRNFITLLFAIIVTTMAFAQLNNRVDKLDVNDLNAKKLTVQSTSSASKPCPAMTEVQRDALATLVEGLCVFNTTTKKLNIYDSLEWVDVGEGSGGGISNWETAKNYRVGDVVIQSAKIYQANTDHVSASFNDQIAFWNLISGVDLTDAFNFLDASKISQGLVSNIELDRLDGVTSGIQGQIDGKQSTITGAATSITSDDLDASKALVSSGAGKVAASTVSSTELGYLSGATSNIQDQLDSKGGEITGAATTIISNDLSASKAVISDANGKVAASNTTSTEIGHLSGVTSAVQTQINSKQATITGAATTITASDLSASKALVSDASGKVAASTVTSSEVGQLSGVTSPIQTQIDGKEPAFPVLPLSKGGTNKNLTNTVNSLVYTDTDSFELLPRGAQGQVLKSGGTGSPPAFANSSINSFSDELSNAALEALQVPNSQFTNIGSNIRRLETGNKNILYNPGFEEASIGNGWTLSAGSIAQNFTNVIEGTQTAEINLSSQTLNFFQDRPDFSTEYGGTTQGLASIRIKTTVPGVKLCARKGGVVQTDLCVNSQASGKWEFLKVPFILGPSTSGLALVTSGAVSGIILVDDGFLGATDLSATQSFDTTCDTLACATEFSANIANNGAVTSENLDWLGPSCNWASTGNANCPINASLGLTSGLVCTATSLALNNNIIDIYDNGPLVVKARVISRAEVFTPVNAAFSMTCQKQGTDYAAAIAAQKAYEKSKISSYSSLNADTEWQSFTPVVTGLGSGGVTGNLSYWRRNGDSIEVNIRWIKDATAGTGSEIVRTSLPSGLNADFSKIANVSGDVPVVGVGRLGNSTLAAFTRNTDPDKIELLGLLGSSVTAGATVAIAAKVPILGWENSNIIIGQFNGLETCKDSYECTDTFSAKVSAAGVVSSENIDWISGNASITDSSQFQLNLKPELVSQSLNCVANTFQGSDAAQLTGSASSTSNTAVLVRTGYQLNDSNFVKQAYPFTIICQKQGADYIGKTAKAVASDQNVRSIGSTNVDIQSVYFGGGANCASLCTTGNCTICSQVGSKITSVSWAATGQYRVNGIDGTKYICNGNGYQQGTGYAAFHHERASSTSLLAYIYAWSGGTSVNSASMSVTCIGIP